MICFSSLVFFSLVRILVHILRIVHRGRCATATPFCLLFLKLVRLVTSVGFCVFVAFLKIYLSLLVQTQFIHMEMGSSLY